MRLSPMLGAAVVLLASCKAGDVLNVPPPATQLGTGMPTNRHDAEAAYYGARVAFFQALASPNGVLPLANILTDEFTASGAFNQIDARFTTSGDLGLSGEAGDEPLRELYQARSSLLLAVTPLLRYEPDAAQWRVGEAYALLGYNELVMAEDYCAGVTLSYVPDGGGIVYGKPLTTDSVLGTAEAHFDSALAHAHGNAAIQGLASVGLGRARLDRAHYASAAGAVTGVPTSFVYNVELEPQSSSLVAINMYQDLLQEQCAYMNVSDREGANGLNYLSAHDQRLLFDSTAAQTCEGVFYQLPDSVFYYPIKFGVPSTGFVPLATGVEARLIEAEAALAANATGTWAGGLNTLRAAAPNTYLALASPMDLLPTDSTTGASADMRVDVTFRERAFWLFGTGMRLGDLRRLIRTYHRDQRTVFPTGTYPHANDPVFGTPIPKYGSDVSLTLPTAGSGTSVTNPYYKGCLTSPGTA